MFRPDAALGPFTLTTRLLTADTTTFDASTPPAINTVTNQTPGLWKYFRIDVPAGVLGWDVRLVNVTGGSPQMVVRRDQLPGSLNTLWANGNYYWSPQSMPDWPSGNQWAAGDDLTGYRYEADGTDAYGRGLHMGMGLPLEPGTYYVGVTSASGTTAAMSYTLQSRGIGTGQSIAVAALDFAGGSATAGALSPREVAYYKVTIPAGQTSWQVKLAATTGDVVLAVRKDVLPSIGAGPKWGNSGSALDSAGVFLRKLGDEHYLLLPTYGRTSPAETTLRAGDYYLAVVSQGAVNVGATGNSLNGPRIGTGNAGYTLASRDHAQTTVLGGVTAGGADLVQTGANLGGGETKLYAFTVPAGLASVQVSLESRTGSPFLGLAPAVDELGVSDQWGTTSPWYNYGVDGLGSGTPVATGDSFATVANPAPGVHYVSVFAGLSANTLPDATYTLRVQGLGTVGLPFDGGSSHVMAQLASSWRYFEVTVPAGVLGWDVRLVNVTGGSPQMAGRGCLGYRSCGLAHFKNLSALG